MSRYLLLRKAQVWVCPNIGGHFVTWCTFEKYLFLKKKNQSHDNLLFQRVTGCSITPFLVSHVHTYRLFRCTFVTVWWQYHPRSYVFNMFELNVVHVCTSLSVIRRGCIVGESNVMDVHSSIYLFWCLVACSTATEIRPWIRSLTVYTLVPHYCFSFDLAWIQCLLFGHRSLCVSD